MQKTYSIGELAKLFKVNIQTLYYYDKIGILKPTGRYENGRRYYDFNKVSKLASIRFMRRMGYGIDQIKTLVNTTDVDLSLSILKEHSDNLKKQWMEMMEIDKVLDRKLSHIENNRKDLDVTSVFVKEFPERYYLPLGNEDTLYRRDSFYFYPTIVFYDPKDKSFGAYLGESLSEAKKSNSNISKEDMDIIDKGKYLCFYHVGPYDTLRLRVKSVIREYAQYNFKANYIALNIVDQFVESDSNRFVTEIQVPII